MTGLIPLRQRFIAGISHRTVSARTLHEFLEVGRDFSNWIRARIKQYGFEENRDFIVCSPKRGSKKRGDKVFAKTGENPKGGRPSREYYLTLDMAKELCMVERTDKGRQARRYFIDCERQLIEQKAKAAEAPKQPALPTTGRQQFIMTLENGQVTELKPLDTLPAQLPEAQSQALLEQINPLLNLFHPMSNQAAHVFGIIRILRGQHPRLGTAEPGYTKLVLDAAPRNINDRQRA